jgi:hypothetical protein
LIAEKLVRLKALSAAAPPSLAADLRPFIQDKSGLVVAAAARLVREHALRALASPLEEAFARLFVDPVKHDPGCRGKLEIAEALRQLEIASHDVFLRGIGWRQPEPSYGKPIDTAAPLRVCSLAALFETRYPFALLEATSLLADAEPNARRGAAAVLANVGSEGAEAVLRLKTLSGDAEPDVIGACMQSLLQVALPRSLPFVVAAMAGASQAVVEQALLALGETRDERALPPLRDHADHPDADIRAAALLGLSLARMAPADELLVSLLEQGPDGRAREVIRALKPRLYDEALVRRLRVTLEGRSDGLRALLEESVPGLT